MSNILIDGKFYRIIGKGKKRRDGKIVYQCEVQYTREKSTIDRLTLENHVYSKLER
jgi:hypothetical protein